MNRIEAKLNALKERNEKAFATYLTGGLPDLESTKRLIKVQEEAGTDLLEIGIPFSDPIADGPVIQQASYEAILNGANTENIFECIDEVRKDGVEIPIVFMTYFNTVLHYGIKKFVDKCSEVGVDGIIIPDLPFEEQGEIQNALNNRDETILIQLIAPVSKDRIPMILENARGFVYCVSAMGVTGEIDSFHSELANCLNSIRDNYDIPIMMGFGIKEAKDVTPMKDLIDGAIVGTNFIKLLRENEYKSEVAFEYCKKFKEELNRL